MNLKRTALLMMGLLPLGLFAQTNIPPAKPPGALPARPMMMQPMTPSSQMPEKGKLSYAIGMYFASNITNSITKGELAVDNAQVIEAITDVMNGKPTKMTEREVSEVLNQLRGAMQARRRVEDEAAKAKSDAYLSQFAKEPGVKTLEGGVEYKVLKEGAGPLPQMNDTVTMAYLGTFVDGKEFDHGDSFKTSLKGGVIPGWLKVLPLMNVGSKWKVVIPPAMGYGPRGRPPKIPANSVLVFEMELKAITPGAPSVPPIPASSVNFAPPPSATSTPVVSGEIIKVPSADDLKKGAKIEVIKAGQTNAVTPQ